MKVVTQMKGNRMKELQSKIGEAEYVLINTCDILPCPPYEDTCNQQHENFLQLLEENLDISHNKVVNGCEYRIFAK